MPNIITNQVEQQWRVAGVSGSGEWYIVNNQHGIAKIHNQETARRIVHEHNTYAELLEALEALIEYYGEDDDMNQARAAVKRARGEN